MTKSDPSRYPKGMDRRESVPHRGSLRKAEAAYRKRANAWISVPVRLPSKIRRMIAKR